MRASRAHVSLLLTLLAAVCGGCESATDPPALAAEAKQVVVPVTVVPVTVQPSQRLINFVFALYLVKPDVSPNHVVRAFISDFTTVRHIMSQAIVLSITDRKPRKKEKQNGTT